MRIYDVAMTHMLDTDDFFIHRVQQSCARLGLNFFLVEPLWVESFLHQFVLGKMWCRVLINMHSEHHQPQDIFHRVVRMVSEKGGIVIDPPDISISAFDKAWLHPKLIAAGIFVPHSVILSSDQTSTYKLTDQEREMIGLPFVIKPSMGYGRKGVILEASAETELARSASAWPNPHYLLQKRIIPKTIGEDPAYFRVFYVFGKTWITWWNCFTDQYREVTPYEKETHHLQKLEQIVTTIAQVSRMNFFSTEVAIDSAETFIAIDYVNDQCHLLTQSSDPRRGVPDRIVREIAEALVEASSRLIQVTKGRG
ncbi:MAG: hypothetical protein JWN25_1102 [Verrucomicrobiales bacterium]|nr:hypothetical protein [Verrucomicrobiales bacterium]